MIYPFSVYQTAVEDHCFWVAKSNCLNGCVGQGDTAQEAIDELAANEEEWLDAAKELKMTIPEIPVEAPSPFSGKFTVRIAASVHEQAVAAAKIDGISLNQYVNDAIVEKNTKANMYKELQQVVASVQGDLLRTAVAVEQASSKGIWKTPSYYAEISIGHGDKKTGYDPFMLA